MARAGQGGANHIGNRSLPSLGGGGHGAFGGMGQGGRVQMNSNRGFASRGGGGGTAEDVADKSYQATRRERITHRFTTFVLAAACSCCSPRRRRNSRR